MVFKGNAPESYLLYLFVLTTALEVEEDLPMEERGQVHASDHIYWGIVTSPMVFRMS